MNLFERGHSRKEQSTLSVPSSLTDTMPPATGYSPPSKSWSVTLNNWTEEEYNSIKEWVEGDDVTYAVVAKEVGEQGTPHLQVALTFRVAKRRTTVSKLPGMARAWLEPTKDLVAWRNYCTKADKEALIKDGRKQGKRADLDRAIEELEAGGMTSLISNYASTYVRYSSGFERLASRFQTPRDPRHPPEVVWIYGPTGLGKSRFVHEAEQDLWVSLSTHKWWDGYVQQRAILIDDMRASWAPFNELLRVLDRYPYRAEKKGGTIQVNSPRIYITTQFPPHVLYNPENRTGEDIKQLLRRITTLYEVTAQVPPEEGVNCLLKHGTFFVRRNQFDLLERDSGPCVFGFNPS